MEKKIKNYQKQLDSHFAKQIYVTIYCKMAEKKWKEIDFYM